MIAQLVEIRHHGNRNDLFFSGLQIERPEIRAAGINHAPLGQGCAGNVEAALVALLPDIAALSVHGKDVHDAVAVREKIYTLIPKHRIAGGTRPIRRQGRRLAAAVEPPKSLVVAALVALGEAGLFSPTGKEECAAVRAVSR